MDTFVMVKPPNLMQTEKSLYASDLTGLAYVKNSVGNSDNLKFFIQVRINTENKAIDVTYTIAVFEGKRDEYRGTFIDYKEAVDKYNELATKWNAYREELLVAQ